MDTDCTPWAHTVLQYRWCGSVGMALLWLERMDADTNLTLLWDTHALVSFFLVFHLFVSVFDIPTFLGAGKSGVSFWHWALDASGKNIFSYGDSHKKLTLAEGLRTCPSWCCCCILLSFPLPEAWGGSRSRNSVYNYEITDIQFTVEFSVVAFLKNFLYCWLSVPKKAVNSGKSLYSSIRNTTPLLFLPLLLQCQM